MLFPIFNQLAATDSKNAKLKILEQNKHNATLQNVFKMAYSRRITYGVTRVPDASAGLGLYTLDQALDVLMSNFATRKVTGNAAIEMLNMLCNNLSRDDFEVLKRIIKRDLDCGVRESLANEIWPGLIPLQPQYLAASYSAKNLKDIVFPAYAQLKADGARCMAVIDEHGEVTLYSRAGNNYIGLKCVVDALKATGLRRKMVDGELIHVPKPKKVEYSLDFLLDESDVDQDLVENDKESDRNKSNGYSNKALAGTISDEEQQEMVFNVWDIVDEDVYWGRDVSVKRYDDRFAELCQVLRATPSHYLRLIESQTVNNLAEAKAIYHAYVEQGREGIILKNKHGLWKDARTTDQIKFKEEIEFDVVIVDVYPHRKDPNKLGGITFRDATGHVECNVGSGFKDKTHVKVNGRKVYIPLGERHEYDRELLMSKASELIGQIVQIKCNGLQRSKGRERGKPGEFKVFLPVFQLIRRDKSLPNDYRDVFEHIPK